MQARDYVRPQYPCIAPLRHGHPLFFIWADALIGPDAAGMGVSVFSDRSGVVPPPGDAGVARYAENARCFL